MPWFFFKRTNKHIKWLIFIVTNANIIALISPIKIKIYIQISKLAFSLFLNCTTHLFASWHESRWEYDVEGIFYTTVVLTLPIIFIFLFIFLSLCLQQTSVTYRHYYISALSLYYFLALDIIKWFGILK